MMPSLNLDENVITRPLIFSYLPEGHIGRGQGSLLVAQVAEDVSDLWLLLEQAGLNIDH